MTDEKKIIVDEDWKNKAHKDKEVVKEECNNPHHNHDHQLPPGDFNSLVTLLATQAMFAMGFIAVEEGKEPTKDLKLAKFHIDMVEKLEEKTKGNLTDHEQKVMAATLAQLRMGFVEASK